MTESTPKPARKGLVRRAAAGTGRLMKFALIGDTREITMVAGMLRSRMHRLLHPGDYARTETFAEACERLGLTPEDIERRRKELASLAKLYLAIAVAALVVFGYLPWSAHRISHALCCVLVLAMALARYSVLRWRQAQCELQDLVPYLPYWRRWWAS